MRMMQTSYKKWVMATLIFTLISTTSNAQNIPWPRTFVGQPDFEYTKEELVKELRDLGEEPIQDIGNLFKQLNINPYKPEQKITDLRLEYTTSPSEEEVLRKFREVYPDVRVGTGVFVVTAGGQNVKAELLSDNKARILSSDREVEIRVNASGDIIEYIETQKNDITKAFDKLFKQGLTAENFATAGKNSPKIEGLPDYKLNTAELPNYENVSTEDKISLQKFATFIENIVATELTEKQENFEGKDFGAELRQVTIQSIVKSPETYVIINNRRYTTGDRFSILIQEKTKESVESIKKLIEAYLPKEESVSKEMYKKYNELYNTALEKYAQLEGENKAENKKRKVSVMIEEIKSREITVSIFGRKYQIELNITL